MRIVITDDYGPLRSAEYNFIVSIDFSGDIRLSYLSKWMYERPTKRHKFVGKSVDCVPPQAIVDRAIAEVTNRIKYKGEVR